jgi:hypothetical protein
MPASDEPSWAVGGHYFQRLDPETKPLCFASNLPFFHAGQMIPDRRFFVDCDARATASGRKITSPCREMAGQMMDERRALGPPLLEMEASGRWPGAGARRDRGDASDKSKQRQMLQQQQFPSTREKDPQPPDSIPVRLRLGGRLQSVESSVRPQQPSCRPRSTIGAAFGE